jgi:hypothetical protein
MSRVARFHLVLVVGLGLGLSLAGCGGADTKPDPEPTPIQDQHATAVADQPLAPPADSPPFSQARPKIAPGTVVRETDGARPVVR